MDRMHARSCSYCAWRWPRNNIPSRPSVHLHQYQGLWDQGLHRQLCRLFHQTQNIHTSCGIHGLCRACNRVLHQAETPDKDTSARLLKMQRQADNHHPDYQMFRLDLPLILDQAPTDLPSYLPENHNQDHHQNPQPYVHERTKV